MHDEEFIIAVFSATLVFIILSLFGVLFLSIHKKKMNQSLAEKKRLETEFAQTILETQLEIQEQTLKTISQELHDNIGQILSLAKLNLNRIDIIKFPELFEKIDDSKNLITKAIHDLRNLSKSLNTDLIAETGLVKAIEYELEMLGRAGFATHLNIEGKHERFQNQKELILFRMVQEIFNNVIKHADANKIIVDIIFTDWLLIKIADNGVGFSIEVSQGQSSNRGLGLRNMSNRAALIGAEFNINSSIGNGTIATILSQLDSKNVSV